jgi:hypothetical protein
MIGRDVVAGALLSAWGGGFIYLTNRYRIDNAWRMRIVRGRWRVRLHGPMFGRGREMGEENWIARYSKKQRSLATWVLLPLACLWTIAAIAIMVHGLLGSGT